MSAKFTPGPWGIFREDREYVVDLAEERQPRSAECDPHTCCEIARVADQREAKANAHAISAVPEMYAALKKAREVIYHNVSGAVWNTLAPAIAQIDAAIAKAEGGK